MVSWKQNFFVIFYAVVCLSHCGDIGVTPVVKVKSNSDTVQVTPSLKVDPSAFTLVSSTSKKEIEVAINLEKVKGASTLVFSTRDSCLDGESKDIKENLIFSIPEDVYNSTFSFYARLKKGSVESSCIEVKKITHDAIAPLSPSIEINAGATLTSSVQVSLILNADSASQMYITNKATCTEEGEWLEYKTSKDWILSQTNAVATIYVKFRDTVGNETDCISESIMHDNIAPSQVSIEFLNRNNEAITSALTPDISLYFTVKGASDVYVTNVSDCLSGGDWSAFPLPDALSTGESFVEILKEWTLQQTSGVATVYAKFRDLAGNESACISGNIPYDDNSSFSPGIVINGGSLYTTSTSVTLTLTAVGAAESYVTNTEGCTGGGNWASFLTPETKSWELSQANTVNTVYVKFKSITGKESACVGRSIIHDNIIPSATLITINSGDLVTSSTNVTLNLTATDASEVYVTNTAGCTGGGSWASFTTPATKDWTLGQSNAVGTVYAKFRDAAGNESACISDTIQHGASGGLDYTFGTSGSKSFDFLSGASNTSVTATALQQHNGVTKILVVGSTKFSAPSTFDFAVARLMPDGTLDSSFGTGGVKIIDFSAFNDEATSVVVTSSGILVAGYSCPSAGGSREDFAVIRLSLEDGALDSSFGSAGKVTIDIQPTASGLPSVTDRVTALVEDSSTGFIYLGGFSVNGGTGQNFSIVALTNHGVSVNSFGFHGVQTFDMGASSTDTLSSIAITSSGLVVAGESLAGGTGMDYAMARLNLTTGELDNTFGVSGKKNFNISVGSVEEVVTAMVTLGSAIFLGGYHANDAGQEVFSAVKLNSGNIDTSFGGSNNGRKGVEIGSFNSYSYAMALQPDDGKILLAGGSFVSGSDNFSLIRLNTDGTLDSSFGSGGKVWVDLGADDIAYGVAVQPDGKIVLVGLGTTTGVGKPWVVRLFK